MPLVERPRRAFESILSSRQVRLGELDLALDRGFVLDVDALLVLDDADLGHLAGQLGVLEDGLGPLPPPLRFGEDIGQVLFNLLALGGPGRLELPDLGPAPLQQDLCTWWHPILER